MGKKPFLTATCIAICALHVSISTVSAQEVTSDPTPTSYELSHPGMLPDHPLYFLKIARDNVMGFFKGDPLDKAAYALLQSDKHIAASHILINQKNNTELANVSLEQAQNYLAQAIDQTEAAKKEGNNITEISQQLKNASKKQLTIVNELEKQTSSQNKEAFILQKKEAEELAKQAHALRP
jgi:hypothetical protein